MIELLTTLDDMNITKYLNISLVLGLCGLGFCLKHLKVFAKVSNSIIPLILMVIAFMVDLSTLDKFTVNTILSAFLDAMFCAAIAIGLFEQSKSFYRGILKKFVNNLAKSLN